MARQPLPSGWLGPGDDAAIFRSGKSLWAWTTDTLVEEVHFSWRRMKPHALGYKSLAVNLSDLAAMGASPRGALLTLGIPPRQNRASLLKKFFEGWFSLARRHPTPLLGGDVVRSPFFFTSVSLLGRLAVAPLLRGRARAGDLLFSTGPLGDSAGGLLLLERKSHPASSAARRLMKRHLYPPVRLEMMERLRILYGLKAAIDSSDGLAKSVRILCEESRTGAELWTEALPQSEDLISLFGRRKARHLALVGGEDYEIIFCAPAVSALSLWKEFHLRSFGRILPRGEGLWVMENGRTRPLSEKGFDQLQRG